MLLYWLLRSSVLNSANLYLPLFQLEIGSKWKASWMCRRLKSFQRLVETLKTTGRVNQTEGMVSFAEVKEILGVEEFLHLRDVVDG